MEYEIEKALFDKGITYLAGVDEAGRGPLAGPVFAAAVVLKKDGFLEGVTDSKKLSEKKREYLFDKIIENAVAYSIAIADEKEIDEINIRNATFRAMNKAVNSLDITPDFVLIDGNAIKDMTIPHECIVKGDFKCNSIAAASILAKVSRDRFMLKCHEIYPEYAFDKHKGYPTKLHYERIREYGVCPLHRLTFLKNIVDGSGNVL
jgi:ribonuclease HII